MTKQIQHFFCDFTHSQNYLYDQNHKWNQNFRFRNSIERKTIFVPRFLKKIFILQDHEIPKKLRNRDHITKILQLDRDENPNTEKLKKVTETTLKELKKLYESAIKPMEMLYKYRDLSNRHFGGNRSRIYSNL